MAELCHGYGSCRTAFVTVNEQDDHEALRGEQVALPYSIIPSDHELGIFLQYIPAKSTRSMARLLM